jgi:Fe-S-cluster containining protein
VSNQPEIQILSSADLESIALEVAWDFSGFEKLLAAVDGKNAKQATALAGQIACKAGCHHCCRRIPTILPVEWAWIRKLEQERQKLAKSAHPEEGSIGARLEGRAESPIASESAAHPSRRADGPPQDERQVELRSDFHPDEPLCGHLDAQGLCSIYAARPLICRTHGSLILSDEGLDHCPWNFQELEEVDEDMVFRLENLHETLLRLNLAFLQRSYPTRWRELSAIRVEFQA